MFSWVTSTLVQGEFGRQQTCQCSPAQSAQSVGGIALWYEIGCEPFTSLSGPYSASCPKVQILVHFSLENFMFFFQTCTIQFVKWKQVKITSMVYWKDLRYCAGLVFAHIISKILLSFSRYFLVLFNILTIFINLVAICFKFYSWFYYFFIIFIQFSFYLLIFSGCKCLSVRFCPDWPPAPLAAQLEVQQSPRPVNSPRDSNKDNSPEFSAWTLLSSSHSIRYPDRVRHSREPHHPKKQKQVRMIKLLLDA